MVEIPPWRVALFLKDESLFGQSSKHVQNTAITKQTKKNTDREIRNMQQQQYKQQKKQAITAAATQPPTAAATTTTAATNSRTLDIKLIGFLN